MCLSHTPSISVCADMTTFQFTYSPEELPPPTELEEEMEASALLANALERMDGLIGDYKYVGCVLVPCWAWVGLILIF